MVRTVRTHSSLRSVTLVVLVAAGIGLTLAAAIPIDIPGADFDWEFLPAIDALARGNLHEAAVNFPLAGPAWLLIATPFDAAVFNADLRTIYLVTALPAVAIYVGAVLWLRRLVERAGKPSNTALALTLLLLVNTAVVRAVHWGHPEEIMCAALLLCAALAASRTHWLVTAVLLGLAVATKQWAVLGALPVICAAPRARFAIAAVAAAVVVLLTAPFVIAAPHRLADVARATTNPQRFWDRGANYHHETRISAPDVIWPFAERRHEVRHGLRVRSGVVPDWVVQASHALIALLVLPLVWFGWRNSRAGPDRWLGVLALIFMLRCLLEPVNFDYYHVAALLFLGAWEGLTRRSAPLLTGILVIGLGITFTATESSLAALYHHAAFMNATYLAWMLPLTAWVAWVQLRGARLSKAAVAYGR
jgi:hypothetical protein